MNKQKEKLKLIYLPFLIIAVCVVGGYTYLHWLLLIKLHLFYIRASITNIYIPFMLPWILLLGLRPRIELLNMKKELGTNTPFLYQLIATVVIAVPTYNAQEHLANAKLIELNSSSQIQTKEPPRFYSLKNAFIDKTHMGIYDYYSVNKENLNMHMFIVLPIFATPADTSNLSCLAWYGIEYHKEISKPLNEWERHEKYEWFVNQSLADLNYNKDVYQFVYLKRIDDDNNTYSAYSKAVNKNRRYVSSPELILFPVNEPFENRIGSMTIWVFVFLGVGSLVWLILLLISEFDDQALAKFKNGKSLRLFLKKNSNI